MRIQPMAARQNWRSRADELGYLSRLLDNPPYWVEALEQPFCAAFTLDEIENSIEQASADLYQLALDAVEYVVNGHSSQQWFERLKIPQQFRDPIRKSWRRQDKALYGRFDFSYNQSGLKMLEMNFDTPTSLYEASIFQWLWLQDLRDAGVLSADCDQFNSLHDKLISSLRQLPGMLHVASINDDGEDEETVRYIQSCAMQAGLETDFIYMNEIGFDELGQLIDLNDRLIKTLFKLYPWEFLVAEDETIANSQRRHVMAPAIIADLTRFIEPPWKLILSNKAILPLLWEMAPNHPNLLEAYEDDGTAAAESLKRQPHVRKPIFGREGGSVTICDGGQSVSRHSIYGHEGFILQALHELPTYGDYHLCIGSWIVGGEPAGMGIRADKNPITGNTAIFVPHYIDG